jgi:hypothetical protein
MMAQHSPRTPPVSTALLHARTFALAAMLCAALMAPLMIFAATAERGRDRFAGRELCYAAGIECGPASTLAPILVSQLGRMGGATPA